MDEETEEWASGEVETLRTGITYRVSALTNHSLTKGMCEKKKRKNTYDLSPEILIQEWSLKRLLPSLWTRKISGARGGASRGYRFLRFRLLGGLMRSEMQLVNVAEEQKDKKQMIIYKYE